MKIFIGVTDYHWYEVLSKRTSTIVNFWRPGSNSFKAIKPGELFLFKLKHPYNAIVGGGYFVEYHYGPTAEAWSRYGIDNGALDYFDFRSRLMTMRDGLDMGGESKQVGSIVLQDPFFFEQKNWIAQPDDWAKNIVTGKVYDSNSGEGARVYRAC